MSEGTKHDEGKTPFDLLPPEFMVGTANVLAFGAAKYGARNWEKGMRWGRPFAAMMRHLWLWWGGQRNDPETGLPHLAHAAACLAFLMAYEARQIGEDDRPAPEPAPVPAAAPGPSQDTSEPLRGFPTTYVKSYDAWKRARHDFKTSEVLAIGYRAACVLAETVAKPRSPRADMPLSELKGVEPPDYWHPNDVSAFGSYMAALARHTR